MALGTVWNHLSLWIGFGLLAIGSCSVYRLKSDSHGLTPLTHIVDGENAKGINLPDEFMKLSRRKRSSPESSDLPKGLATEFEFKNDGDYVGFIHWSGKKSKILFFFTCGTANRTKDGQFFCDSVKLWRSTDYGQSFRPENGKFKGYIISGVEFCAMDYKKVILSSVKNKTVFVSSDEGDSYVSAGTSFSPYTISCNPGSKTNVLVAYDVKTSKLYYSDRTAAPVFGAALSDNVNKFFWDLKLHVDDSAAIYLEVKTTRSYLSLLKKVVLKNDVDSKDVQIFDKHLGTFTTDSLQIEGNYIFVKKHVPYIGLYVYSMLNSSFFHPATFPLKLQEKDYVVVDATEYEVMVAVRHQKPDSVSELVSNLYVSEITGSKYSLSLENVLTVPTTQFNQKMYVVDIHRVQSTRGTYLANTLLDRVTTAITFNKGGEWYPVAAPQVDQHGNKLNCELPDCSLHIHMTVSKTFRYISPVLSSPSAVGLLIAQGNVGSGLTRRTGMFSSRDGGITWQKALDDEYDFAIGDHGGIIVAVPMLRNTTTVWYSCTEGISWKNVTFGNVGYHVFAVITEPGDTTLVFNVFGHYAYDHGYKFQWLVIKLDFQSVLKTHCKADNYTLWSPSDEHPGTECLLGQKTVFERRKAEDCCYNGGNYSRKINVTSCKCDIDDFQCDIGFEHHDLEQVCIAVGDDTPIIPSVCPEGKTYLHTTGYRKVPGDHCQGGLVDKFTPEERPCPITVPEGLRIPMKNTDVAAGEKVTFGLEQQKGSKMSTWYVWSFNDSTPAANVTGFDNANQQTHVFEHHGTYIVSVFAKNKAGFDITEITVNVLDSIDHLEIEPAHAVVVGQPAIFNVTLYSALSSLPMAPEYGFTHFVWNFGDKGKPLLTFEYVTEYTFSKTGKYSINVEGINAVSRAKDKVDVVVHESLTTVRVEFDDADGEELTRSLRTWFAKQLQDHLQKLLLVDADRLEVAVLRRVPTTADVSITPRKSVEVLSTHEVVKSLEDVVHRGLVVITLPKGNSVTAVSADEISVYGPSATDEPPSSSGSKDNRLAVAVGVASALLLLFLGLVVFYFYRRYKRLEQRYIRLQHQDREPLLQNTDDDDDDDYEVQTRMERPGSVRYAPLREADMGETDDELLSDLHTGSLVVMNNGFAERGTGNNTQNAVPT